MFAKDTQSVDVLKPAEEEGGPGITRPWRSNRWADQFAQLGAQMQKATKAERQRAKRLAADVKI